MEPCWGHTGQSSAPFDAHAQFRIVDHDRASINRTSTNSANRHVAMIGTYGETIPVEGFMDRGGQDHSHASIASVDPVSQIGPVGGDPRWASHFPRIGARISSEEIRAMPKS